MKAKKILLAAATLATALSLASCGESGKSANEFMSGFKTKLENGSVKGTFKNNYEITVDANGGTADFSSFKHKIEATVDFEFTLGDDFYFYAKKTWEDKLVNDSSSVTEELLYKDNGKYMYSNTYDKPVEVTTDVKTKINEILTSVTKEQAGSISLDTFVYSKDANYELNTFGLTTTFGADELIEFISYSVKDNNLVVDYKPEYVGYQTDNGMSDFPAAKDKTTAADITVNVNELGYVTSWNEEYHAGLDFAIMTPAPTVGIIGSRSFNAEYGVTLTTKTDADITHKTSEAKVTYGTADNGIFTVAWFDYANNNFQMNPVANNDKVRVGMWLGVKPTANDSYEIDTVTVNGVKETVIVQGIYCFEVKNMDDLNVVVKFKKSGEAPAKELLGKYQGSASNGTVMDINVYKDGTFTVTCPGFNGQEAGSGTYTKDGFTLTLTSNNMKYFTVVNTTITVTMANDFSKLTTTSFFNGEAIEFVLQR